MDAGGIYAAESSYLGCYLQIGVASQKVISVSFPESPEPDADAKHEILDRIFGYLEGVNADFSDVEIGLTVPTDHRTVLETTRSVPYGKQVTVEELGGMIPTLDGSDEEDLTTIRTALAENPVPIIVPDHRVRDGPSGAPPHIEQKLRHLEGL